MHDGVTGILKFIEPPWMLRKNSHLSSGQTLADFVDVIKHISVYNFL